MKSKLNNTPGHTTTAERIILLQMRYNKNQYKEKVQDHTEK